MARSVLTAPVSKTMRFKQESTAIIRITLTGSGIPVGGLLYTEVEHRYLYHATHGVVLEPKQLRDISDYMVWATTRQRQQVYKRTGKKLTCGMCYAVPANLLNDTVKVETLCRRHMKQFKAEIKDGVTS